MATPLADEFAEIAKRLAEIEADKAAEKPADQGLPAVDECKPADCGHIQDYGMGFCEFVCGKSTNELDRNYKVLFE